MNQIDWNAKLNNLDNDIYQTTKEVINAITEITNKHTPVKVILCSKSKQSKTKQKMYKTHFDCNNAEKINQYKKILQQTE